MAQLASQTAPRHAKPGPSSKLPSARKQPVPVPAKSPKKGPKTPLPVRGGIRLPEAKGRLTAAHPKRLIMMEFLVCFAILGFGTLVPSGPGEKDEGIGHLAAKGSALAMLFFVLSLVASGGDKASKVAGAVGGLVAASYVLTSNDATRVMAWISNFYAPHASSTAKSSGYVLGSNASLPSEAGAQTPVSGGVQYA